MGVGGVRTAHRSWHRPLCIAQPCGVWCHGMAAHPQGGRPLIHCDSRWIPDQTNTRGAGAYVGVVARGGRLGE